jgi:DNA-binding MarR family transcriptional regulator
VEIATSPAVLQDERIGVYGRLLEAQRRLHRIFEQSLRKETGLSIIWFDALLRLGRSDDHQMPINVLGEQLVLSSGGATRLVDRLEENGLVERIACPSDRRVLWARLTDKGLDTVTAATHVHIRDLEEHFSSHMSVEEIATLTTILDRFRNLAA